MFNPHVFLQAMLHGLTCVLASFLNFTCMKLTSYTGRGTKTATPPASEVLTIPCIIKGGGMRHWRINRERGRFTSSNVAHECCLGHSGLTLEVDLDTMNDTIGVSSLN
jgi:hypothetical protein